MKIYLFLFLFYFVVSPALSFGQEDRHYVLHPSVGDTIERLEKLDYSLFPFLENDAFEMATIGFENESFFILAEYDNSDSSLHRLLTQEEIIVAQQTIEKINAFYRRQAKEAEKSTPPINMVERIPNKRATLNAPMNEKMLKDVRMYQRLREDEIRRQEFINGTRPNQIHIEFR